MLRRSRTAAAVLLTVLLAVVGCSPASSETAYATVTIGSLTYRVELAQTAEQQQAGLGNRQTLPAGTGMLFQFGSRSEQQVWMTGMRFPLDIAWIADGRVVALDTLATCAEADESECPRWTSPSTVDALLEVPADSLGSVGPGTVVTVEELP